MDDLICKKVITGFDFMLDEALRQVPYLSAQCDGDGIYVVLNQEPKVEDFLD